MDFLATVLQGCIQSSGGSSRTGTFHRIPVTVGYITCSVNDTPNLGRYVTCLEVVKPVTAGYMPVV